MKKTAIIFVSLMLYMVSISNAGLNADFTDTTMNVSGPQTIRIYKIKVEGYPGTYWADFKWNPQTYMLEPVAAGQETAGTTQPLEGPAAFPMHIGEARYKLYYGDPSITTGKGSSTLPFLGPKKLIYADGKSSGTASIVDFEDWEAQSAARDVIFLWPNGEQLNATAEGYIDDYHFLSPTGSLDLQVMYMAITDGNVIPFSAAAVLSNP